MHFAFSPLFQQTSHITKSMPRKALVRASEAPPLWLSRRSGWVDPEGQPGLGPGCPSAGASGCSWPAGDSLSRPAPCPVALPGLPRPGAGPHGGQSLPHLLLTGWEATQQLRRAHWTAGRPVRPASEFPRRVSRRQHRPQRAGRSQPHARAQRGHSGSGDFTRPRPEVAPPQQAWGPGSLTPPQRPAGRTQMHDAGGTSLGTDSAPRPGAALPPDSRACERPAPRRPRVQRQWASCLSRPARRPDWGGGPRSAGCALAGPRGTRGLPGSRGLSSASRVDDPELRGL